MTSREESNALTDLHELLASDLSKVLPGQLFAGIKKAELVLDSAQTWTGRLVAEARRRGIPWSQLEAETGVSKATLDRRAQRAP